MTVFLVEVSVELVAPLPSQDSHNAIQEPSNPPFHLHPSTSRQIPSWPTPLSGRFLKSPPTAKSLESQSQTQGLSFSERLITLFKRIQHSLDRPSATAPGPPIFGGPYYTLPIQHERKYSEQDTLQAWLKGQRQRTWRFPENWIGHTCDTTQLSCDPDYHFLKARRALG